MREIVLSTDNINKLREIREILEDLDIKIYGKSDIEGLNFEVIEDGDTLYDNALKKAYAMAERVDYAVLSDDTGLFVKALNGEPGVHSASIPLMPATPKPGINISKPSNKSPKTKSKISNQLVFPLAIFPQKKSTKAAIEIIPPRPKPGVKISSTAPTIAKISKIVKI